MSMAVKSIRLIVINKGERMRTARNIGGHNNHYTPADTRKRDLYRDLKEVWESKENISEDDFCKKSLSDCKAMVMRKQKEWYERRANGKR